jgi:hypothetical protein
MGVLCDRVESMRHHDNQFGRKKELERSTISLGTCYEMSTRSCMRYTYANLAQPLKYVLFPLNMAQAPLQSIMTTEYEKGTVLRLYIYIRALMLLLDLGRKTNTLTRIGHGIACEYYSNCRCIVISVLLSVPLYHAEYVLETPFYDTPSKVSVCAVLSETTHFQLSATSTICVV